MKNAMNAVSLLIVVIVMITSVLGVVSLVTAKSDLDTARRQVRYTEGMQKCQNEAERWLAGLRKTAGSGSLSETEHIFTDGNGHCLDMAVELENGQLRVIRRRAYTEWTEDRMPGSDGP